MCQRIELAHVGEIMSASMVLRYDGVPSIEGEGGYHYENDDVIREQGHG